MGTTKDDIRQWLDRAKRGGATHVIVACDTHDYSDFPVVVLPGEDARGKAAGVLKSGNVIMEVYSLALPIEAQLNEYRASHYETTEDVRCAGTPPAQPGPAEDGPKRLFIVTVTGELAMVATSLEEAGALAEKLLRPALVDGGVKFDAKAAEFNRIPAHWDENCLPYGYQDADEPDRTIRGWIDAGAAPLHKDEEGDT